MDLDIKRLMIVGISLSSNPTRFPFRWTCEGPEPNLWKSYSTARNLGRLRYEKA